MKKFFALLFLVISLTADPASFCEPRAVLPPCNRCTDFYVSASLLLWQTKMWGLEFATKSRLPNTIASPNQTFSEQLYAPDFAWNPGVQLILGANLPYDGWDFRIGWIFYKENLTNLKKNFHNVTSPDGLGMIPLWRYPFVQIVGDNIGNPLRYNLASANWQMTFNTFDLELGRLFVPNQTLPMRITLGIKTSRIEQKYSAQYDNGTTVLALTPQGTVPSLFQFVKSRYYLKNQQWGLGPRVGLESKWKLFGNLSLIGDGAFSILFSSFHIKSQYNDVILPTPGTCSMAMKESFHELTPVCEGMLGFDWGTCFSKKYYFGMNLGYEWQYWWSMNHARRNYVQTLPGETFDMRGEMQMQGLNAAIKFDY